jgi:hypothetical protein
MPRSTHAEAILGPEFYSKLSETRALIVGAGGSGCELCKFLGFSITADVSEQELMSGEICLVKNVAMTGLGNITLLDLDTIDLSNLNRQFLFRKVDVKQSKAMVSTHFLWTYLVLLTQVTWVPFRWLQGQPHNSIPPSASIQYMRTSKKRSMMLIGFGSSTSF